MTKLRKLWEEIGRAQLERHRLQMVADQCPEVTESGAIHPAWRRADKARHRVMRLCCEEIDERRRTQR